jgi:DnaJ-class molecular chaperone
VKTARKVEKVELRCSHCSDTSLVECPNCGGRGQVHLYQGLPRLLTYQLCYYCCGEGVVPCLDCALEAVRA